MLIEALQAITNRLKGTLNGSMSAIQADTEVRKAVEEIEKVSMVLKGLV